MDHIYNVSELNQEIKSILEARYPFVQVSGEISSLRKPYSGHIYFTLKDNTAQIKAVLFKMQQRYLTELPQDGKQVICRGRISVYEPRGDYQLIVDTIDYHGRGSLQAAFEELKRKLSSEGLFDLSHKRKLPPFPKHITLVTSPQGAAVHDFINIATRRFPPIRILVYPVAVQGDSAPAKMIKALHHINEKQETDVIVLCRGGGSIEDLWAYNSEQLARTIHSSDIPVVSAVGHEIDFTIADLAADLRAPTPSGAAELLVPDKEAFQNRLSAAKNNLLQSLTGVILKKEHDFNLAKSKLTTMPHPLDSLLLRVDRLTMRLERSTSVILERYKGKLQEQINKIEAQNPSFRLSLYSEQLGAMRQRFLHAFNLTLQEKKNILVRNVMKLDGVSPLATLSRGYAIARKKDRKKSIIRDSREVIKGENIEVIVEKGTLSCCVKSTTQQDNH